MKLIHLDFSEFWKLRNKNSLVKYEKKIQKLFDMDMSIGWETKKFICHVLVTPRLSHKDTFIMSFVAIVTMKSPCSYVNYKNTFMV